MRVIALLLTFIVSQNVFAECMGVGRQRGTPIPTFRIISHVELLPWWKAYTKQYPNSIDTGRYKGEALNEFLEGKCLIETYIDKPEGANSSHLQKYVLNAPCKNIERREEARLITWIYCQDVFNGNGPDFLYWLGVWHAEITRRRNY